MPRYLCKTWGHWAENIGSRTVERVVISEMEIWEVGRDPDYWVSLRAGPVASPPPFCFVSVSDFPEHLTWGGDPARWSQLNSGLTHDWPQCLKFIIRVRSQHTWQCRLSPQAYSHQLSCLLRFGPQSSWSSDPATGCVNGPLEQHAYAAISQSKGHNRCLRRKCQRVGQNSYKNKVACFLRGISEGLWFVEIALAQCKKKKIVCFALSHFIWKLL